MERYSEEYKEYYDKIRKKVKGKTDKKEKIISTRDDVYPNIRNVQNFSYQRGSYGAGIPKKSMGYIDKFILRLICTFLLFLGVFTLKTIPSSDAKKLYNICKTTVDANFNYENVLLSMDKMGIDYKSVINVIEEKYTDVMGEIKNLDNGVPSFKEEGIKTNVDESINNNESSKVDGLSDEQDEKRVDEEQSTATGDTNTNDL
ncbi:peptidase M23 [Clostridium sp.]|uniref:peptidase M23 n=1 Tax=Clostridium sp. TaxID=1506 RepID=UPI0025BD55C5|nr:peptidase M23 [Clostridium sp.]